MGGGGGRIIASPLEYATVTQAQRTSLTSIRLFIRGSNSNVLARITQTPKCFREGYGCSKGCGRGQKALRGVQKQS